MLVQITDAKNKIRFINAGFVKSVHPKGETKCQVEVSGWATKITVNQDAQTVAAAINAAMPNNFDAILAAEEAQIQGQEASTIAAIG